MKYSFVLLAYNEENTIAACIESIIAQEKLGSSYEILVVDDGSTDSTSKIVKSIASKNNHVRLLGDGQNHGRGYGRHLGANRANGQYVAMIDSDIVLPKRWLATCLEHTSDADIVGGIAVPDGDVAFVYRQFKLTPKPVMGSTTITGNNGLYRRSVFESVQFNPALREGEDVDFNHNSAAAGIVSKSIDGLTVKHQEHKSFTESLQWLYQSGIGATRQLFRFKQLRLPDIAFAGTFFVLILAIVVSFGAMNFWWLLTPLPLVALTSLVHLRGRFLLPLNRPLQAVGAIAMDTLLLICYYAGRVIGIFVYMENKFRSR